MRVYFNALPTALPQKTSYSKIYGLASMSAISILGVGGTNTNYPTCCRDPTVPGTHGDIVSHDIMVDENSNITGIIDWEYAGWYLDYWEYVQILRPAFWGDWSIWMERTAPERWDLTGVNASRKVLF